jgi:GST-like protein
VWAMVRWRPGRAWFEENTPKLAAIARRLDGDARLDKVKARNFPG